jgi:hypothetical protein
MEQHRRVLQSYGMKSIDAHAAAGDQVRRVFYVDGYGRDLLAISFIRSAGRDPILKIQVPRSEGAAVEVGETLVPEQVWERVITKSAHFDRALAPRPAPGVPPICLHSWVYTIEAVDPVENGSRTPNIRRETEDACEQGLGQVFASELVDLAVPLLPYCAALDRGQQRNSATLLNDCAVLRGDRLAAAKAHNQLLKLNQLANPVLAEGSLNIFQNRASFDWNGEQIGGNHQAAARAWIARTGGTPRTSISVKSWTGERFNRVRAEGELTRWVGGSGQKGVQHRASLVLIFTQEHPGAVFRIERATVGAFAPVPQR